MFRPVPSLAHIDVLPLLSLTFLPIRPLTRISTYPTHRLHFDRPNLPR